MLMAKVHLVFFCAFTRHLVLLDFTFNGAHTFGALSQLLGAGFDLVKTTGKDLTTFVFFKLLLGDTRVLEHHQRVLDLFLLANTQLLL